MRAKRLMPYLSPHSTMKPPLGARINPAHPFAQDMRLAILFNETYAAVGAAKGLPLFITAGPPATAWGPNLSGTATWVGNTDGAAFNLATSNFLTLNAGGTSALDPVPTSAVTLLYIRRKTDTTLRTAGHFGGALAADLSSCGAHVPWVDGTVYWDFGGVVGAHRLSVAGLSFAATVERWIFTAGPQGSAIWRNGVKVASQATAI